MAEASQVKTFILSDESLNTYGFRVMTKGIDLSRFKQNPVMLFNHNRWGSDYDGPIGAWKNIRKEGGQLLADADFDEEDEKAKRIAGKVSRGFLRGASIGIIEIIEWSEDPDLMLPGQKYPTITKCVISESSVCDIPSNENAIALLGEDGRPVEFTEEAFMAFLSHGKTNPSELFKNNMKQLAVFAALFGLAADKFKNEDDLLSHVTGLKTEYDAVKLELDNLKAANLASQKTEIKSILDAAEKDGRVKKENRASYEEFGEKNFNLFKTTLADLPKAVLPTDLLAGATMLKTEIGQERATWTLAQWSQNDYQGLLKIKAEDPEEYARITARKPAKKQ